jgi:hypothetical protein
MKKVWLSAGMIASVLVGCSAVEPKAQSTQVRDPKCTVNLDIERNAIPQTPNQMSLPSFGQGIIGWATGPEGAEARLASVSKADIPTFKEKGVTLAMVEEWQAFYDNEVKRNPCNPTAPFRAQLMKKIAMLWVD